MTQPEYEQKKSGGLLSLGLKPLQIPVKFLDTFKLSQPPLFFLEYAVLLVYFPVCKFLGDASFVFKYIELIHRKNQFELINPIFHIHQSMIGRLSFRKCKILLHYQLKVVEFLLCEVVLAGIGIRLCETTGFTCGSETHHGECVIGAVIPQLGRSFAADRPKKLVLDFLEELFGYLRVLVVVITRPVYVFNLLIEDLLLNPYRSDALDKLAEIIHRASALESLVIEREPFDYVVAEALSSPDAELSTLYGFDPVSDRDNDIKVVIVGGFFRKIGISDFLLGDIFVQFTFRVYIENMFVNCRTGFSEQFSHLVYGQPNRFIGKEDIYLDYSILGLIYYYLVIHNLIKTSAPGSVRNKVTLCEPTSEAELNIFRESVTNHMMQK